MKMIEIVIAKGRARFIYDDEAACLLEEGDAQITRASHVEPATDCTWQADMSPVGGPVLTGFQTRTEALAAEVKWLQTNRNL